MKMVRVVSGRTNCVERWWEMSVVERQIIYLPRVPRRPEPNGTGEKIIPLVEGKHQDRNQMNKKRSALGRMSKVPHG